jgi:catalase
MPAQAPAAAHGYVTHPEVLDGPKVRQRGETFFDHYSQARMFFASQSAPEKHHLIKALRFELGKVQTVEIRERMVLHLAQIDATLATSVAKGLGLKVPAKPTPPPNMSVPADGKPEAFQHRQFVDRSLVSAPLSMRSHVPGPIATRKVAILVADGFDAAGVAAITAALEREGATAHLVGPDLQVLAGDDGKAIVPKFSIVTSSSVLFDAVVVAGGAQAGLWTQEADAIEFVKDAYKHCKAVAATGGGVTLLEKAEIPVGGPDAPKPADDATIVAEKVSRTFTQGLIAAMREHRLWTRELELHLPL